MQAWPNRWLKPSRLPPALAKLAMAKSLCWTWNRRSACAQAKPASTQSDKGSRHMTKTLLKSAGFGAIATAMMPSFAAAQDAVAVAVPTDSVFILNSLLFLIGGFLVFWMAAGFAMLEAGLVRSKNVTMQLTKNIALFALAAIAYYVVGYNLMYPGDGWTISGVIGAFSMASLEPVGLAGAEPDLTYAS